MKLKRLNIVNVKTIIIVPFILVGLITFSVYTYFSLRANKEYIDDLIVYKQNEISTKVSDYITNNLALPFFINKLNKKALENGELDLQNKSEREKYFARLLEYYPSIKSCYFGTLGGSLYGAKKSDDGEISNLIADETTYFNLINYSKNQNEKILNIEYDFKLNEKSWFVNPSILMRPAFSNIFKSPENKDLAVIVGNPLFTTDRKFNDLIGVFGVEYEFSELHKFLKSIPIPNNGFIYILDDNFHVVSSSNIDSVFLFAENKYKTMRPDETKMPVMVEISNYFKYNFNRIDTQKFERRYEIKNKKNHLYIHTVSLPVAINQQWFVFVALPAEEFTSKSVQLNDFYKIFLITSIVLIIILGIYLGNIILKPIIRLNFAIKSLNIGNWDEKIKLNRNDEIGKLSESLAEYNETMKSKVSVLENEIKQKNTEFNKMKVGLINNNVNLNIVNEQIFESNLNSLTKQKNKDK